MIVLRDHLSSLAPYRAGRVGEASALVSSGASLLASNELPFDPLPCVVEALATAAKTVNRYPDPSSLRLREAIATLHGVEVGNVAIGAGSVEVLRQALFAVASDGDEVVVATPSFPEYVTTSALSGARAVEVPLVDHVHDLETMAGAIGSRTRAVVVCNPNNPTGTVVSPVELAKFVADVPAELLVVLDEAYAEFAPIGTVNGTDLARRHDNVLVLRTFSKAYGLAGLRVGYGIGSKHIVDALSKTRIPFGVSGLASSAAIASLDAVADLAERVQATTTERDRVAEALRCLGLDVPASHGNFLWLPLGEEADALADALQARAVMVRLAPGGLRVTVGGIRDDDRLVSAIAVLSHEAVSACSTTGDAAGTATRPGVSG